MAIVMGALLKFERPGAEIFQKDRSPPKTNLVLLWINHVHPHNWSWKCELKEGSRESPQLRMEKGLGAEDLAFLQCLISFSRRRVEPQNDYVIKKPPNM